MHSLHTFTVHDEPWGSAGVTSPEPKVVILGDKLSSLGILWSFLRQSR